MDSDGNMRMLKIGTIDQVRRKKTARRISNGGVVEINLLDDLDWIQGSNTTMTISAGRVRATSAGGNPRVFKNVAGLTVGRSYKAKGNIYQGTGTENMFLRASEAAGIPDGTLFTANTDSFVNGDFTATASSMYIGLVAIKTAGQYAEIDEAFALIAL